MSLMRRSSVLGKATVGTDGRAQHPRKKSMPFERVLRWTLVAIAIAGLVGGIFARTIGRPDLADVAWELGTGPVIAGLAFSIFRDLLSGRLGVDAIALLSMSAALALGQPLAGAVVALMYSGGNVLEDIASHARSATCGRWSIVRRVKLTAKAANVSKKFRSKPS